MNILIVDDDQEYLDIVRISLKSVFSDINIKTTTNGKNVITICQDEHIDLILLDLNMLLI